MRLNLGCGRDIKKDYLNCDISKKYGADKIVNLNKFPYPFKDNFADEIYMNHILEHLDAPTKVLNECHRILRGGVS